MDEDNRLRKMIIDSLKKNYQLQPLKGFKPNLSFAALNKGQSFRHLFTWMLTDFKSNSYLCSIRNSYEVELMNPSYYFSRVNIPGRYYILVIEPGILLPDLVIRPAYLADKIGQIFLRSDRKIEGRKTFNRNYVVETKDIEALSKILTSESIDKIQGEKNFYLEIIDNRILIKYEEEQSLDSCLRLLEIGKLFDNRLAIEVAKSDS